MIEYYVHHHHQQERLPCLELLWSQSCYGFALTWDHDRRQLISCLSYQPSNPLVLSYVVAAKVRVKFVQRVVPGDSWRSIRIVCHSVVVIINIIKRMSPSLPHVLCLPIPVLGFAPWWSGHSSWITILTSGRRQHHCKYNIYGHPIKRLINRAR